jgi:2,4'-dihydroxyacetophenone dioxygenase
MSTAIHSARTYWPAQIGRAAEIPWIPSDSPGKSSKPLRFLRDLRGFVELLRLEPGAAMPLHRHGGEIHAHNLSGSRQLCTGEIIGPGDYVYEPPGNVDWWKTVGDEPVIVFVVVMGEVEFLGADDRVLGRASAASQLAQYQNYCREQRIPILDLVE